MSMMVPAVMAALEKAALDQSPLFSPAAIESYRDEPARAAELKASIPLTDESVATFVRRHFGDEVLATIAAPLLSGVFGGDVATLSVRAVMPAFVAMEREHGSLITALQSCSSRKKNIFTSLRTGTATLVDRMIATIPTHWLHLNSPIVAIGRDNNSWTVQVSRRTPQHFDAILLAVPVDAARKLLAPLDPEAAVLLDMESSSAVIVAFALSDATRFRIPVGFGFLVPQAATRDNHSPQTRLLACTFVDQKFPHRVPPAGRLIRAFFGGAGAERMMSCNNDEIASIARLELGRILGPIPDPQISLIRRWPRSLPQYAVGHLDRMANLASRVAKTPGLYLLGNPYRGVGLPDLIRDSRAAAQEIAQTPAAT